MSFDLIKENLYLNGKSYLEYSTQTFNYIAETDPSLLNESDRKLFDYTKLNYQRSSRLDKSYIPSEDLKTALAGITGPQIWMIITESWCGDSAQIIPIIAKAASLNSRVELKIIERDANSEIMDLYLTNGTRSIPLLVVYDAGGKELFRWGPRPSAAAALMLQMKTEGLGKKEKYEKLHLWYGRNRGAEIDRELSLLISSNAEVEIKS